MLYAQLALRQRTPHDTLRTSSALYSSPASLSSSDDFEIGSSYVWVIAKDRVEWKRLSVTAEDVSKSVESLRIDLNPDAPKPFDRKLAYQLYQQLLGPIEEIISQKARLSFVLDGALTSLPPQVLITSDPARKDLNSVDWLIRKYAVTVLPSIASLKILRGEKSTVAALKPMIGFGDPVFDRTTRTIGRPKVAALNRTCPAFTAALPPTRRHLPMRCLLFRRPLMSYARSPRYWEPAQKTSSSKRRRA